MVTGIVLAPLVMPILPVPEYVRYAKALGVAPGTPEDQKLSELPQFFADMNGWEELARDVSAAYRTIPETERRTTVALVGNYGEAGAIELYAARYPLPRVICTHNSYWFWGTGAAPITTFIRLGGKRDDYLEKYGEVTPAGSLRYACPTRTASASSSPTAPPPIGRTGRRSNTSNRRTRGDCVDGAIGVARGHAR